MASDMVVALARATSDGQALFGHNHNRSAREVPELVRTALYELPQVRQTLTVLGGRSAGQWGYSHGVNQAGVAVGLTRFRARLCGELPGLTGPALVRLALERAHGARQAVELLTDLISRHGQVPEPSETAAGDAATGSALLVA